MKKFTTYLFLSIFFLSVVSAQYGQGARNCILCAIDVGGGWYQPSLDYWNDESYLAEINGSFNGGIIGVVSAEFKIYEGFMGGIQAGYWKDVAEVVNAGPIGNWNEKVEIAIIPVTVFGKYEFSLPSNNRIYPFIGAGYTMNLMSQDVRREVGGVPTEIALEGTTQTASLMVGAKYAIASHFDVGIEYNYVIGTFDQDFIEDEVQTTQAVGLDGSLILAKLSLTIDDRINPSRKYRSGKSRYKPGKRRKSSFKRPKRRGSNRKSGKRRRKFGR